MAGGVLEDVKKWEQEEIRKDLFKKRQNDSPDVEATTNKINLACLTEHLPFFTELRNLTALQGDEYTPILKGVYYCLLGVIIRDKKIQIGKLKTDCRISLTIPLPSGQGKGNIKNCITKIMNKMEYDVHVPLSFHSQQLIGKVVNRGTGKKPDYKKIEGFLSRDFLIFDEAFKLFTSRDEEIQESRRAIRIAKDTVGENLIEKKQVDNDFTEEERISYYPKITIVQFLQPKTNLPSDIVEEGDLRRDLVLYVRGISQRNKSNDYCLRLDTPSDDEKSITVLCNFLRDISKLSAGVKFIFTAEAINKLKELHLILVRQGFLHSDKGLNFTKSADYTLQNVLVKLSCCNGAMHKKSEITVEMVELAFMDLMEFFTMQLDFIKEKINGKLDYGEAWQGAENKDQLCLEWLYQQGATNEEKSIVSIGKFKEQIAIIRDVGYNPIEREGQANKIFKRFRGNGWVDSKQVGQHDSKVWLTFQPLLLDNKTTVTTTGGEQDGQGVPAYQDITSNIKTRIEVIEGVHPNNPEDKIEEVQVDLG